jgi:hypothetical protein
MIAAKAIALAAIAGQVVSALPTLNSTTSNSSLPVVDFGYALHRATINVCLCPNIQLSKHINVK